MGLGTFFLAVFVGLSSQGLLESIASLGSALLLLALIIFLGIIFDMIGVAAAAATEVSLHARAAKKVPGAKQAVQLVRNAERVSSFCNDVVGDICATISGAIGALIALRVLAAYPQANSLVVQTVMMAAISALTVGGKAGVKKIAIREAEEVIFRVGSFLAWLERNFHLHFFNSPSPKKAKGRRT